MKVRGKEKENKIYKSDIYCQSCLVRKFIDKNLTGRYGGVTAGFWGAVYRRVS